MANITRTSQIDQTARGMLGEAPKDSDLVLIKDVSDATSGGGGRDKYVTVSNLVKSVGSVSGLAGSPGVQGPRGPQGPKGDKGDQGIQGLNGLSGQDGTQGPQGIQGQRGAPGPTGISPAGLSWQGTWVSARLYEVNDTVSYEGASYFCITGNSGTTPPDQSADFALLAAQGADGAPGANGVDGSAGIQGIKGDQGEVGPQGPAGPAGADGVQGADGEAGEAGQRGPQGEAGEAGATVFTELDQIPDNLNPGAYLRVNSTGDGLINVNQAPPDGGIRSLPQINARNKTGLPIPDKVMFMWNGNVYPLPLMTMTESTIYYSFDIADNDYMRVRFNNAPDGPNVGSSVSRYFGNGSTSHNQSLRDPRVYQYSLKQFIYPSARPDPTDTDKLVIFEGQQSGTSGAGNLNVIKTQTEEFYTELPDAIVATHNSGHETILRLKFAKNITNQPDGRNFYYEARFDNDGGNDYIMVFKDDDKGTFMGHDGQGDNFPVSMDQNLRWFIENGRALYYGSQPSTSRVGQAEDVRDVVPLASSIELPDAILDHDAGENSEGNARLLIFEKYNDDHFQYVSAVGTTNYVRFDATTGARVHKSSNSNGDFDTIQEYISNGKALYFGGTSNAGIGVTKFTGLEDTPAALSSDKILKTNSTGDQIILVDDVEITSIDDLTDVQTSGTGHEPEDGDILVWNESMGHWMPGKATGGGGGSVSDISGLIRHYNLDGNLDDVTNTAHLTSTGDALSYESGKYNQAVKLNGTNNKLRTGLVMPATSSISLWYKHNNKTGGETLYIFGDFASSGVNSTNSVSLSVTPTNTLNLITSAGDQYDSPSSHSDWHHAVLTRSGGAWKLYLDGTEVHSGTAASASNALVFAYWTSANLSSASSNFFGGWLDNIRIYNKQLTASEVTTLYNQ